MTSHSELRRTGPSRRAFLSAGAVTAVAAPIAARATRADAATAAEGGTLPHGKPSADLQALLRAIDPDRIHATILRLTQFGTRNTLSSQTDPVRGIGTSTATSRWSTVCRTAT